MLSGDGCLRAPSRGGHFERDGELHTFDTFKLGRACWFVRCEDGITHVDYCEGEEIPACP